MSEHDIVCLPEAAIQHFMVGKQNCVLFVLSGCLIESLQC